MIDFSKAFPERTAANIGRVARQEAMRKACDPFGGLDDDVFSKVIHHHFENGHRVVVNSPGHETHGHAGVIMDDRNDNRLEIKLDSGHTIHCTESELMHEDFPAALAAESEKIAKAARNPMFVEDESEVLAKRADGSEDPVPAIVENLKRGGNVTLPGHLRKTCEMYPLLQKLISADKIRFQEKMYY